MSSNSKNTTMTWIPLALHSICLGRCSIFFVESCRWTAKIAIPASDSSRNYCDKTKTGSTNYIYCCCFCLLEKSCILYSFLTFYQHFTSINPLHACGGSVIIFYHVIYKDARKMPSKVLKKSKIHQLKLKVTEMVENLEGELNFFVVEADKTEYKNYAIKLQPSQ